VPAIACPLCGKPLKLPSDFDKARARCPLPLLRFCLEHRQRLGGGHGAFADAEVTANENGRRVVRARRPS
jgi:hypothetical protein